MKIMDAMVAKSQNVGSCDNSKSYLSFLDETWYVNLWQCADYACHFCHSTNSLVVIVTKIVKMLQNIWI